VVVPETIQVYRRRL